MRPASQKTPRRLPSEAGGVAGIVFFAICIFAVYLAIPITAVIVALHFICKYW
jgi:hypothetical protein